MQWKMIETRETKEKWTHGTDNGNKKKMEID